MTDRDLLEVLLQKITAIEEDVKAVKTGNEQIGKRLDSLEGRFDTLEGRFDSLEEKFDSLERKVNVIQEQTATLTEFQTEVNKKLDSIMENNLSITQVLGEHEIAIRTIRRRIV